MKPVGEGGGDGEGVRECSLAEHIRAETRETELAKGRTREKFRGRKCRNAGSGWEGAWPGGEEREEPRVQGRVIPAWVRT